MNPRTKLPEQEHPTYLLPGDAARRLFTTPNTLRRMAERGDIRAITLPSGHHRYLESDVESMRPKSSAA